MGMPVVDVLMLKAACELYVFFIYVVYNTSYPVERPQTLIYLGMPAYGPKDEYPN